MKKIKSSRMRISSFVADSRTKAMILLLAILFSAGGVLWQEKYISFDLYTGFSGMPNLLQLLYVSIAIGLLILPWLWIFKLKRLTVKNIHTENKIEKKAVSVPKTIDKGLNKTTKENPQKNREQDKGAEITPENNFVKKSITQNIDTSSRLGERYNGKINLNSLIKLMDSTEQNSKNNHLEVLISNKELLSDNYNLQKRMRDIFLETSNIKPGFKKTNDEEKKRGDSEKTDLDKKFTVMRDHIADRLEKDVFSILSESLKGKGEFRTTSDRHRNNSNNI